MGLAWGFAFHFTKYLLEKNNVSSKGFTFLFWSIFICSWVGAKVFFLLTSGQTHLKTNTTFWLGGGFVFYGGFVFSLFFTLFYTLVLKKFSLKKMAYFLPALAFSHAIGRVGCFMAGCCYGTVCELPWSIHLHGELRHPVQLYEGFGLVIIGFFLLRLINSQVPQIKVILSYMASYALLRFSLEFFRGDKIRGLYYGLSTSQWVAFVVFTSVLLLITFQRKTNS